MALLTCMYIWGASCRCTARHIAAYAGVVVREPDDLLAALRWHWGEAYVIANPEPGVWLAERRDDHTTLRADTPIVLRRRILRDYAARPVGRECDSRGTDA
jgi:hypothetical protein